MIDQFSSLDSMTLTRFLCHLDTRSGMIMHVKEQLARNSIQKRSAARSSPLIFSISHLFRNWCGVPPGLSLYDLQHLLHGTDSSDCLPKFFSALEKLVHFSHSPPLCISRRQLPPVEVDVRSQVFQYKAGARDTLHKLSGTYLKDSHNWTSNPSKEKLLAVRVCPRTQLALEFFLTYRCSRMHQYIVSDRLLIFSGSHREISRHARAWGRLLLVW